MKESELRKHPVVTVYCDGPDGDPHERFVIVQFALTATLPVVNEDQEEIGTAGMWKSLTTWEYAGRHGRARWVGLTLQGGKPIPEPPIEEVRKILLDADRKDDFGSKHVFPCRRCEFDEKLRGGASGSLFSALDTVACVKFPWLTADLPGVIEIVLDQAGREVSADEIEVRELIRRTRFIDGKRHAEMRGDSA
jgi:hypothetical protein